MSPALKAVRCRQCGELIGTANFRVDRLGDTVHFDCRKEARRQALGVALGSMMLYLQESPADQDMKDQMVGAVLAHELKVRLQEWEQGR